MWIYIDIRQLYNLRHSMYMKVGFKQYTLYIFINQQNSIEIMRYTDDYNGRARLGFMNKARTQSPEHVLRIWSKPYFCIKLFKIIFQNLQINTNETNTSTTGRNQNNVAQESEVNWLNYLICNRMSVNPKQELFVFYCYVVNTNAI